MWEILHMLPPEVLIGVGSVAVGLFKAVKFVQEGQRGIKLRFGRAVRDKEGNPKIINPGFALLIPFVDILRRRHVRAQTIPFHDQQIMLPNGLTFTVNAFVMFRVKDIYRVLFEVDQIDHSLANMCMGLLRDELAGHQEVSELANTEKISEAIRKRLEKTSGEWGVEFLDFKLTKCAPTEASAHIVNMKSKILALKHIAGELGMDFEKLSPTLIGALIGAPLTTSLGSAVEYHRPAEKTEEDSDAGTEAQHSFRLTVGTQK